MYYCILEEILMKIWDTKNGKIWKKYQEIILVEILRKIWYTIEKFIGIFITSFN